MDNLYLIQKLDLSLLSEEQLKQYYSLSTSAFHSYLHPSKNEEELHLAIAATFENIPVGIALAKVNLIEKSADFDFLYVDPDYRFQGIGYRLIQALETELHTLECFLVGVLYPTESPTSKILEHLLKKSSWAPPEAYMHRYFFDVKKFNPLWLKNVPTFPEVQKVLWKDLSTKDKDLLFAAHAQGHFPETVWPWSLKESQEADFSFGNFSFGLKYQEKIIGWLITHEVAKDTLNYAALFIVSEFQKKAVSIRLLIDVIQLQQKSSIPWAIFDVNLKQSHHSWQKFVKQRLSQEAQKNTLFNRAWKILKHPIFNLSC